VAVLRFDEALTFEELNEMNEATEKIPTNAIFLIM